MGGRRPKYSKSTERIARDLLEGPQGMRVARSVVRLVNRLPDAVTSAALGTALRGQRLDLEATLKNVARHYLRLDSSSRVRVWRPAERLLHLDSKARASRHPLGRDAWRDVCWIAEMTQRVDIALATYKGRRLRERLTVPLGTPRGLAFLKNQTLVVEPRWIPSRGYRQLLYELVADRVGLDDAERVRRYVLAHRSILRLRSVCQEPALKRRFRADTIREWFASREGQEYVQERVRRRDFLRAHRTEQRRRARYAALQRFAQNRARRT